MISKSLLLLLLLMCKVPKRRRRRRKVIVSPSKRGRQSENEGGEKGAKTIISPSQFFVPAETEDEEKNAIEEKVSKTIEQKVEEIEEGEVHMEKQSHIESIVKVEKPYEKGIRPSLPHASKSHKTQSDSSAQNTKEQKLGATSIMVQKKKH